MNQTDNNIESHENLVKEVVFGHFGKYPEAIERMKVGMDNEVYSVDLGDQKYIVRLNQRESLKGSSKNIPLFQSKGIKVPEIIAEDYSKSTSPYNWQILARLEGTDIDKVILTLSEEQLDAIAKEIAGIEKKLVTLPTNGMYGWVGLNDKKLKSTLTEEVEEMLATIKSRNKKTGAVKEEYIELFAKVLEKYKNYFNSAPSQFYFDDMSSKNVMIHEGKFSGLVDLDGVAYGDPLEGIGRIKASWYGTTYGDYYANAVMDALELSDKQREAVTMWALLNRIYWQAEIGVQFNQNSSLEVDPKRVESGNIVIEGLANELGVSRQHD